MRSLLILLIKRRHSHARGRILATLLVASLFVLPLLHAQSGEAVPIDEGALVSHLNAVINWYKKLSVETSPLGEPSDTIYATNAQSYAAQAVRLAFQSARAQAQLLLQSGENTDAQQQSTSGTQRYAQLENDASERVADDKSKLAGLKSNHKAGAEQVAALEGKLDFDEASLDAIRQLKEFVAESNSGGTGLERNINELARSVPEVFHSESQPKTVAPSPSGKTQANASSGLFGQLVTLYKEVLGIRSIEQRLAENDAIQKSVNTLRDPLRKKITETLEQGKDLGAQNPNNTNAPNQSKQNPSGQNPANKTANSQSNRNNQVPKQQYETLTAEFKQLAAALVPLSEERMLLDQSRSNLLNWRKAHTAESQQLLISIVLRVAAILVALAIVFGLAEAWRRLTFRYVHDPRRRRQFLLLRRFVMGFFMALVIVMGFVSEFSSLATFAGFATAGLAVALQTVLLSVAAYFFVIGRYGIRVGDRITIAGVTGDVIDLGLVRFYVMEFAASGAELFPTGRIVVFSNSVLFQPTTPLFRQMPGTHYTWHEAVVPLANGADRELIQKEFGSAVQSVYQEVSRQAEWQRAFDYNMDITMKPPAPEQRLHFGDTGAEIVFRYPVDLHRAPEMDEKVLHALLQTLAQNGEIASGISGTPKIRTAVKV